MSTISVEVPSIFDSVIGRNLVPSQPIYLLILLQSIESQQHGELQSSSFAYYYQFLISKCLFDAGVRRQDVHELFNYLSNLAWFLRSEPDHHAAEARLSEFNRMYSARYHTVELTQRLSLLKRAKLLSNRGGTYSFTYPYIYYFFLGHYLNKNLGDDEVRRTVETMCAELHKRDSANAILFLSHHTHDLWVIEKVAGVLGGLFKKAPPVAFGDDVKAINELVEATSQLVLKAPDVEKSQTEIAELKDKQAARATEEEATGNIIADFNLLLRTAEILGLILKNYYGSLDRPLKGRMLSEVFDAPLRFLHDLLSVLSADPERLLRDVEKQLDKRNPNIPPEKKRELARKIAFQALGLLSTSIVFRSAQFVASDKLREDIDRVCDEKGTNAYRLIQAATQLILPGAVPLAKLKELSEDLQDNPVGFGILQSLGALRMHLFHMPEVDRQALCAHLKISLTKAHKIEAGKKGKRVLNRPQGTA